MNIIVDKNTVVTPISKLVGITEKRSLMPILSNILIEFGTTAMTIYSTDLEVSAIGHVNQSAEQGVKILVHGRKFLDILKELDNGQITLKIEENSLTIEQGQTEIVLGLQDPEEFPEVKALSGEDEFEIEGKDLLNMIEKVDFAVSTDETRFVLTGMFMKGLEGKIAVVGTDGFRMAQYEKSIQGLREFKGVTIPKRSLAEVERVVSEQDKVKLTISDKHVQFRTADITVVSRVIEGNFPDYENVIPANTGIIRIEKDIFLKGLKKVSTIIGRQEPVKLTLDSGRLEIDAISDIGRAKEILAVIYDGPAVVMNFNVRFLLDVVTHIGGPVVIIKAPAAYGAVLFEGEETETYRNIVMPIRV